MEGDIQEKDAANAQTIQVLVRVRPLFDGGALSFPDAQSMMQMEETVVDIHSANSLAVTNADGKRQFQCAFDAVLGPFSTQSEVYRTVQGCTRSVLEGVNSTIFAYGQTGSGKTFSMYGPPSETGSRTTPDNPDLIGVIPRAVQDVFDLAEQKNVIQLSVYCSFVQIYNEQLFDMLRDASMMSPLTIREDQRGEIYVQGLSEYNVKNVNDTLQLLRVAEENRTVRETYMNQFSSRSHSIFQIYVEQKRVAADGGEVYLRAKFNLVDLAGSEKWNTKKHMREEHIVEMTNINLSLHTLGRCISSLASISMGKDAHVPYRESKLTRLLQDSLGGNARTFLIATISPSKSNAEESISTLKFADSAKRVMVQAIINETRPVDHALVMRLQGEVERLRSLLRQMGGDAALLNGFDGSSGVAGTQPGGGVQLVPFGASASSATTASSSSSIASTSVAMGLLSSLEIALTQERERATSLNGENEALKRELASLRVDRQGLGITDSNQDSKHSSSKQAPAAPPSSEYMPMPPVQAAEALRGLHTLLDVQVRVWSIVEKMQKAVKRFFKFELEEEGLRTQLDECFASMGGLKRDSSSSQESGFLNILLKALSAHAEKSDQQQQQATGGTSGGSSSFPVSSFPQAGKVALVSTTFKRPTPPLAAQRRGSGSGIQGVQGEGKASGGSSRAAKKAAAAELKAMLANDEANISTSFASQQHQQQQPQQQPLMATNITISPSKSEPSIASRGGNMLPSIDTQHGPSSASKTMDRLNSNGAGGSMSMMSMNDRSGAASPVQFSSQHHLHQQQQQQQQRSSGGGLGSGGGYRLHSGGGGSGASSGNTTPIRLRHEESPSPPPSSLVGSVSFRVRGSTNVSMESSNGNGGWLEPLSEEEEELRLQKEMLRAKKKLRKQQQLQDWLREKEQRALAAQNAEEEERRAQALQAEIAENKRREYAKKQKEKLSEYGQRIKRESEQIKELLDLGIDPASLM